MNPFLEKIASQSDNSKRTITNTLGEAAGVGLGASLLPTASRNLLGYETVYHGTSDEGAKNILKNGLRKQYGGTRGAKVSYMGESTMNQFIDEAKKHVYVTKDPLVAASFAGDSAKHLSRHGNSPLAGLAALKEHFIDRKGKVLKAHIPYRQWKNHMEMDPDSFDLVSKRVTPHDQLKDIAARSKKDIPSSRFAGGEGNKGILRTFLNKRHLKHYYADSANRARVLKGVGAGAAGVGLIGLSAMANANNGGILSRLKGESRD